MRAIVYQDDHKSFIDSYDKVTYKLWNQLNGIVSEIRKSIREHYLLEQKHCCAYCRIEKKENHGLTWDVEHILPKSLYPQFLFEPENLAISCKECNGSKDNSEILCKSHNNKSSFPKESDDYNIVHPHFDVYSEHFEICVVAGKRIYRVLGSDKSKATYIACNFFRFDYKYAEWNSFDAALVGVYSDFLDSCPPDATPAEIKRMLGHVKFGKNVDFEKF